MRSPTIRYTTQIRFHDLARDTQVDIVNSGLKKLDSFAHEQRSYKVTHPQTEKPTASKCEFLKSAGNNSLRISKHGRRQLNEPICPNAKTSHADYGCLRAHAYNIADSKKGASEGERGRSRSRRIARRGKVVVSAMWQNKSRVIKRITSITLSKPKRTAKALLGCIGLYDEELKKLGLRTIQTTDTFLCSFPKSGNTWVRFIIANLTASKGSEITFRNIDSFVPEIERAKARLNAMAERPLMKTHWPFLHKYPRCLYLVRDPRDAYLSFWHYTRDNYNVTTPLSEFIKGSMHYGPWDMHVQAALKERKRRPRDVCIVRYEDLLAEPGESIARMAEFLKIDASSDCIQRALANTSLDRLRQMEAKSGPETDKHKPGFFRVGKAGQWKTAYSADDLKFFKHRFGTLLERLGYDL